MTFDGFAMSFLSEIQNKKENLKLCKTVITSLTGSKYIEVKNEAGEVEATKLPETCFGFVVDEKLDLQISEILGHLYLSSQDVAQDLTLLKENGITHVLSVGVELPPAESSCKIHFKNVELLDEPTADFIKVFDTCFEFIENSKRENSDNKILVHCNAGYSRAPTVIIAYLMKKYGYSLKESFNIVKEKRNIKPNAGFMDQLKKLEKTLGIKLKFFLF